MKSFVLGVGPFRLEVTSDLGGRATRLVHGDQDLFTDEAVNPDNHGSTYWPSPQELWGWPPIAALDNEPYDVLSESPLVLRSRECSLGATRVRLEKSFSVVTASPEGFVIDRSYRLENVGDAEVSVAGWEICRVAPAGLTFFPTGQHQITPVPPHGELPLDHEYGFTFFEHAGFLPGASKKLHADGREGFLAHLARTERGAILFLKLFEDTTTAEQAPGEGEVEIFANEDGRYVEVEVQGAFRNVPRGGVSEFSVRWVTADVPESALAGREALIEFTRSLARRFHPKGGK